MCVGREASYCGGRLCFCRVPRTLPLAALGPYMIHTAVGTWRAHEGGRGVGVPNANVTTRTTESHMSDTNILEDYSCVQNVSNPSLAPKPVREVRAAPLGAAALECHTAIACTVYVPKFLSTTCLSDPLA